jgi:hypothetical protein
LLISDEAANLATRLIPEALIVTGGRSLTEIPEFDLFLAREGVDRQLAG